jgi:hypothetical protein
MAGPYSSQPLVAYLPVLAPGRHADPRDGACFMEMASLLAGEGWSDHPRCTHPVIGALARAVNDHCSEAGRRALAPHVPDVIGLDDLNPRITTSLLRYCADAGLAWQPDHPRLRAAARLARGRARLEGASRARRAWERLLEPEIRATAANTAVDAAIVTAPAGDAALVALLLGGVSAYRTAAGAPPRLRPRAAGASASPIPTRRNHG